MPKPYAHNPRSLTAKRAKELEASLDQLGDLSGIVHDLNSDEIIGGNQRMRVFGERTETIIVTRNEQPDRQGTVAHGFVVWHGNRYAYRQVDWDEATAREANIRANLQAGEWDWSELAAWNTDDLKQWGFDSERLREWNMDALNLRELQNAATVTEDDGAADALMDRAAELQKQWKVHRGDIFEVGRHRLMCGDSTSKEDVGRLMDGDRMNAIVTDPPYSSGGLHKGDRAGTVNSKYKQTETKRVYGDFSGDNRDQHSFIKWCLLWMNDWREHCDPESYLFIFSDWRQLPLMTDAIQMAGWLWRGINVWDKGEGARMASQAYFRAQAEFAIWATNGQLSPIYEKGRDTFAGVLLCSVDSDKKHLTQKPIRVIEWLIGITKLSGIVFDGFMGSGTTLVACEQTGRVGRGMEIEPKYVSVCLERLTALGLSAKRISDDGNTNGNTGKDNRRKAGKRAQHAAESHAVQKRKGR